MKAMLLESGVHSQFWAEAAKMFVYVNNLLPRKKLGRRSSWSAYTGKPDPPILRFAFGEKISFWIEPEHASKLKPRGHLGQRGHASKLKPHDLFSEVPPSVASGKTTTDDCI